MEKWANKISGFGCKPLKNQYSIIPSFIGPQKAVSRQLEHRQEIPEIMRYSFGQE